LVVQGDFPPVTSVTDRPVDAPAPGVERSEATGWVGWVLLGGILLVLLGVLHLCIGLLALFRPEFLAGTRADLALPVPLTVLGWIHLVVAAVAVPTGVGLIRGRRWARLITIQLACVASIVNFAFAGVYPVWSILSIGLAVVVSYAVARHGAEVADAYGPS
jgi:hypothetical protein